MAQKRCSNTGVSEASCQWPGLILQTYLCSLPVPLAFSQHMHTASLLRRLHWFVDSWGSLQLSHACMQPFGMCGANWSCLIPWTSCLIISVCCNQDPYLKLDRRPWPSPFILLWDPYFQYPQGPKVFPPSSKSSQSPPAVIFMAVGRSWEAQANKTQSILLCHSVRGVFSF